jgi:hypothetical protein
MSLAMVGPARHLLLSGARTTADCPELDSDYDWRAPPPWGQPRDLKTRSRPYRRPLQVGRLGLDLPPTTAPPPQRCGRMLTVETPSQSTDPRRPTHPGAGPYPSVICPTRAGPMPRRAKTLPRLTGPNLVCSPSRTSSVHRAGPHRPPGRTSSVHRACPHRTGKTLHSPSYRYRTVHRHGHR